jgi:excisionase family DNA binding protein
MPPGHKDDSAGDVEPRFYTLEQTASYLNVSVPQVYSLVRSGRLPAIKIGGRGVWRVPVDKLEEYVERLLHETEHWVRTHPLSHKDEDMAIE